MMFLDLQFSETKFNLLLQDQVQRVLPVVTDPVTVLGTEFLIDHLDVTEVEIGPLQPRNISIEGPAGTTTVPGNAVRLIISVKAKLATSQAFIDAGHLGVPSFLPADITVEADMTAQAGAGKMTLSIVPVSINTGGNLTQQEEDELLAKLPSLNRDLPLPDIGGKALTVSNAGVTFHDGVIDILVELTPPSNGTVTAWTAFYNGEYPARPGEWSIELPTGLIVDVVNDAVTDAVDSIPKKQKPDDETKVEIVSEPTSSWNGSGVSSTATLNAIDACPVFDLDIEFDLNFTVTFSLDGDKIKVTVNVEWDLNDWDVFVCGLATVVLPGAIVTAIVGLISGPIGAVIAAVVTIIAFIVALVAISDGANGQLGKGVSDIDPGDLNLHTVEQDDSHAKIEGSVGIGGLLEGMVPTSVQAGLSGLVIAGMLNVPNHQERSLFKASETTFDWDSGYSCSKAQWVLEQIEAKLAMTEPAKYPIQVKVSVLSDPPTSYTPEVSLYYPVTGFSLAVHSNLPASDPTACELMIYTNSGIRYANFGHLPPEPKPPSSDEIIKASLDCFRQQLPGPKKWLEAKWLIDPPPYESIIDRLHLWEVMVTKAEIGSLVEVAVVGARGDLTELTKQPVNSKGHAAFRFATKRGQSIAISTDKGVEHVSLFATGAALEPVARLAPLSGALDAWITGAGDNAQVHIVTANQILRFGIDGSARGATSITPVATASDAATRGGVANVRRNRWLAEPWMATPIRTGRLAARVENGAVTVYRYVETRVF